VFDYHNIDKHKRASVIAGLFFSLLFLLSRNVFATGEIAFVRAPETIPEGDDVTIVVSASARETNIDRTLALEFPAGWKMKRAWRVEAGSDHAVTISHFDEVTNMLSKEPGHETVALADYSNDFDPDAAGMAYFIVFSTKPVAGKSLTEIASVKAALIERTDPDAPPEIDPKTKKKIPVDHNWRMTYPTRYDFSFAEITSKRLMASITIERVPKAERALVLEGTKYAIASLQGRTDQLRDYFQHPFSVQCWFRTTGYDQKLLRMQSENGSEVRLDIGVLGQPTILVAGKESRSILTSKAITNDGAWHNLVFSKDSVGNLRLFVDAQPPATEHTTLPIFDSIITLTIGDSSKASKDFSIDELRFLKGAYKDPADFTHGMMIAYRDTSHRAFAIFHFDDFTSLARSSVNETSPLFFTLDSFAFLRETASPVEAEPATLSADLSSPTKVALTWQTSSELGIKQYILERRVGPYGPFEKALTLDAKHGIKVPKRGQPVVSRNVYHATEELPPLKGDIDLYYRIALVGFNEKEPSIYTFPVKLEYAPNRDVFVEQNDPNPFNAKTSIAFRLTKPESVRLSIFDMIGREVTVLADEKLAAGRHSYDLDATTWPQGIYFYKVKTNSATVTRKMVLLK
jgi:hypothetical protein